MVCRGGDVYGDGVNIASRIEPLAEPGGISLSEDVSRQVGNKLQEPVMPAGQHHLKNIDLPMRIYRVVLPWAPRRAYRHLPLTSLLRLRKALILALLSSPFFWTGLTQWAPVQALESRSPAVLPSKGFQKLHKSSFETEPGLARKGSLTTLKSSEKTKQNPGDEVQERLPTQSDRPTESRGKPEDKLEKDRKRKGAGNKKKVGQQEDKKKRNREIVGRIREFLEVVSRVKGKNKRKGKIDGDQLSQLF